MRNVCFFRQPIKRYARILLSMLLFLSASTVAVSSASALEETEHDDALTILQKTVGAKTIASETPPAENEAPLAKFVKSLFGAKYVESVSDAANAAAMLRYEYGLVSTLPEEKEPSRTRLYVAARDAAERMSHRAIAIDLSAYTERLKPFDAGVYANFAAKRDVFAEMAAAVNDALAESETACLTLLSRYMRDIDVPLYAGESSARQLSWQEMAALYRAFGDDASERIASSVFVLLDGSMKDGAAFSLSIGSVEQIASCGTRAELLSAKFTLAYLNTVYDDNGVQKETPPISLSDVYLSTLAHPLPGRTIKNGWYLPRSHKTRLHTGTDILAHAREPILSVTDGVVLYIGYAATPGNYVIIRDPYGYEYHYYHMNEITTFVKEGDAVSQGQQIGRVGNTGNSDAYHLHLAIVTPENVYLNPYEVFSAAGFKPIRPA